MRISSFILFFVILSQWALGQNYPYRSDILWLTEPDHKDWIYQVGEEAFIDIAVYRYGIPLDNETVAYSLGPELMTPSKEGEIQLINGKSRLSIGTLDKPGFKDCRFTLRIDGDIFEHHVKLGFDPEDLSSITQMPADFNSFWLQAKEKASTCPMTVTREFVPEYSNDKLDCYLIKMEAVEKENYVYGYLTMPKKEGKFPVVFSPPGAGIKPMNPSKHLFYAENDLIRFDMEIHGIRSNLDTDVYQEISRAFGHKNNSYLVNGIDNKNGYYMKKVYLSCIRAIDYLTTLPEWDGKNMIAQGGSQGGALALITTGLDERITACAANHPALSDMAGYKAGRAGGYPHFFTRFDGMDTTEKINTMAYFDVVNFAKLIKVPVFMTWGFNDDVCPPTTSYIVYNALTCKKESLITPINEHWVSTHTRYKILEWIQAGIIK